MANRMLKVVGLGLAGALSIYHGQTTGSDTWTDWTEFQRVAYVSAFVDGYLMGMATTTGELVNLNSPKSNALLTNSWAIPLTTCLTKRTVGQAVAMVNKYWSDHPEKWHRE